MQELSERILHWYDLHGRKLPWRTSHPDPYAVWASEIMLQQTRVETVIPYFERWMRHFPTISALAEASEQQVLSLWEGLGYYSRARNFHKAAQIITADLNGEIPRTLPGLLKLPGIGRYTAGAIASIAFGLDEPTLDANLRRIFARVFNITVPADSNKGESILWRLVQENLPAGRAGDFNQALMDLGAAVCLPHNPTCLICPLSELCQARRLGLQEKLPLLKQKTKIPHYTVTAAVFQQGDKVLLARRPSKGLLGGMWEFPGGKLEDNESLEACLQREILEELGVQISVGQPVGIYSHAYTHFSITLHAFQCKLQQGEPQPLAASELAWVPVSDLDQYPMGKVDRRIASNLV